MTWPAVLESKITNLTDKTNTVCHHWVGLTVSLTTERPHPVGGLWPGPLDVTQQQGPDGEALLMGQQARVFSPGGEGKEKQRKQEEAQEWKEGGRQDRDEEERGWSKVRNRRRGEDEDKEARFKGGERRRMGGCGGAEGDKFVGRGRFIEEEGKRNKQRRA